METLHLTPANGMAAAAGGRPYLRALDVVLAAAVAYARVADPSAAEDRWRGLHLDAETAEILARGGGLLSGFRADPVALVAAARQDAAMALLARLYGLSDFALAALALAVAPEADARYGRIFGFLQDDVTRRLPTPALALDLFGGDTAARDRRRLEFTPGAQLVAQHLIAIEPAANETALTAPLRLDPQIRQLLLGEPGVDPRLAAICTLRAGLTTMDKLTVAAALSAALRQAAAAANRAGFAPFVFAPPDTALRRRLWEEQAAAHGVALAPPELDTLAARFRVTQRQIAQAASGAAMALHLNPEPDAPDAGLKACFASTQALGGHELMRLAKRIVPRFAWGDIVTTEAVAAQLREICDRVKLGATVLEGWRFADKLALGRGVSALFAGPSGTGKTMAAEVIAGALSLDLFKIDLASVVSKYIGETEKNLDRIFGAAEDCNGILLFDEADALFGKRSEVHDSHDRYANLEISYLLQKMEEFEGVAILSTNLQKNLDDAFTRRLSFIVHFPFPNVDDRKRIWEVVWPDAAPRDPGLRFDSIADSCKLSGGNIKSAALGAAYCAAAEGRPVGIAHVVRAIGREYEKLGRPLKPDEIASMLSQGADR